MNIFHFITDRSYIKKERNSYHFDWLKLLVWRSEERRVGKECL